MYQLKMQSTLLVNVKELVKNSFLKLFFLTLLSSCLGCQDKSYFIQTYDEELLSQKITCLKLKITPHSDKIYNEIKDLYKFENNCTRTLEIKYKTQIVCNSNFSPHKDFNSFIELNLQENNKTIHTIYKDLKNEDVTNEIIKGYKILCKTLNL
jgi:polyribonucleotide nucleotidyltransferase